MVKKCAKSHTATKVPSSSTKELRTHTGSPGKVSKGNCIFLDLITKSTIIVFIFCIQPIIVDVFWYLQHRGGLISVLIPLNMMSLNMVIDAFCILLFNKFGHKYYDYICKCENKMCADQDGRRGCHFCCQDYSKCMLNAFSNYNLH